MKPVMFTTHIETDSKYDKTWRVRENKAIIDAGFELVEVAANHFGVNADLNDYKDRDVAFRCYANQEHMMNEIFKHIGARNITPDVHVSNNWYKLIDRHDMKFFGRDIGHLNLKRFGYLETYKEMQSFEVALRGMFDNFELNGQSFVKSSTKSSFVAKLRTYKELLDELTFALGVSCHNTPIELIFSKPLAIKPAKTDYKREEYRTFVVNGHPVTTSIFTDTPTDIEYQYIHRFVRKFAKKYESKLPNVYCIDTARDKFLGLIVVELNGFAASGFYADHNINTLFAHLKELQS